MVASSSNSNQQAPNSRLCTQLKVSELKTLLKQRSKPHSGNKETLQSRLRKCLVAEGHDPDAYYFDESLQGSFIESSTLEQSNLEAVVKEVEEEAAASALLENEGSEMGDTAGQSENGSDGVVEVETVESTNAKEIAVESQDKNDGDANVQDESHKVDDFIDLNVEEKTEKEKEPESTENNAEAEKVESEKEVLEDYSSDEAPKPVKPEQTEKPQAAPASASEPAPKTEDTSQAKSLSFLLEKHKDHIVWISKLSPRTAAKDLNELGQKKGRKVLKIKILESTSDSSKVAFIIFEDAQMAKDSIKHFNESKINGEKVEAQIASPETVNKLMNPKAPLVSKNEKPLSKWDEKPSKLHKPNSNNYSVPAKKHSNSTTNNSSSNYLKSSRSDDSYGRSSYKYNDSRYSSSNISSSAPKRPLISHSRYDAAPRISAPSNDRYSRDRYGDRSRASAPSSSDHYSSDRYDKPAPRNSYNSSQSYRDTQSLLGDQPHSRVNKYPDAGVSSGHQRPESSRPGLLSNPFSNNSSRTADSGYGHRSDRYAGNDRYDSNRYPSSHDSRAGGHDNLPSSVAARDAYSKKYSTYEQNQSFNSTQPGSSREVSRKEDEIELLKRELKNLKEKIEYTAPPAQPPQSKMERPADNRYDGPYNNRYEDRQQNYSSSNYRSPYHGDERPAAQPARNLYPDYSSRSTAPRDQYSSNHDIHNQQQHHSMEPKSRYDSYSRERHTSDSHYRPENDASDFKRLVSSMNSAKQASAPLAQEKSWNSSSNSMAGEKFYTPKKYGQFNARSDEYSMKSRSNDYSNERPSNYPSSNSYADGPMNNSNNQNNGGGYRDNFGTSPEKQSSYGKFNVDPRWNVNDYSGRSQHSNSYSGSAAFTNLSSGNGQYGNSASHVNGGNNSNAVSANNKDLWVNPLINNKPSPSLASNKTNDSMSNSLKSTSAALQSVGRYFSQQQQGPSDQQNKPSSSSGSKLPGYYN